MRKERNGKKGKEEKRRKEEKKRKKKTYLTRPAPWPPFHTKHAAMIKTYMVVPMPVHALTANIILSA